MKRTINTRAEQLGAGVFSTRRRQFVHLSMAALVAFSVAACGDDESGRRFANETPPTFDPSSFTPTVPPATVTVVADQGPAILSPEALIVSRGAPSFFYVPSGDELLAFSADGATKKSVWKGKSGELRDVASSPSGDRAAILTERNGRYDVIVVDHDGKELKTFKQVRRTLSPGTPSPTKMAGRDLLDWSPQGNELLATFESGGIVGLPLNGDPRPLLTPQQVPGPIAASWSPAGDAIAFVGRNDVKSPARLYRLDLTGDRANPAELAPKSPESTASVVNLGWLPDASAILYTQTNPDDELPQGGDLFEIPARGGDSMIVVSSRRAAPVAAIEQIVASPNGRAIAYGIVVPGDQQPEFHSLWVQQLGTGNAVRLSTPPGERVTDVWFVNSGIAYRTVPGAPKPGDENSVAVYIVGADSEPRQVMATGSLVPATPEASPVGSPDSNATPVG
jgi:Tol biopolymer transport system component